MNSKELAEIRKEHLMLEYFEYLLRADKKRLRRILTYIKDRCQEETAMDIAKETIERVKHG